MASYYIEAWNPTALRWERIAGPHRTATAASRAINQSQRRGLRAVRVEEPQPAAAKASA